MFSVKEFIKKGLIKSIGYEPDYKIYKSAQVGIRKVCLMRQTLKKFKWLLMLKTKSQKNRKARCNQWLI